MLTTADPAFRFPSVESTDDELFRALPGASPDETQRIYALLVSHHAGLVGWLAARYSSRAVGVDELRQVGYVGLMLAIRRFDVERGYDFGAFARPTVQGEIRRHFRDRRRWIRLPRQLQTLKAALRLAEETLSQTLGRWPTIPELAAAVHATEDQVIEALAANETFELASLDSPPHVEGERAFSFTDATGTTDHRMDLIVDCLSVRPLIAKLSERERRILHLRFFEDKSQTEIGKQLGISQMHVSRLLARTMSGLRMGMETGSTICVPVDRAALSDRGRPEGPRRVHASAAAVG